MHEKDRAIARCERGYFPPLSQQKQTRRWLRTEGLNLKAHRAGWQDHPNMETLRGGVGAVFQRDNPNVSPDFHAGHPVL